MQTYWSDVCDLNERHHIAPEFSLKINIEVGGLNIFTELANAVNRISEIFENFANSDSGLNDEIRSHLSSLGYELSRYNDVAYYENPFFQRNWEMHSLAVGNALTDLTMLLKQAEIRFLEEYVKTHSNEIEVIARLESAKANLRKLAISVSYLD